MLACTVYIIELLLNFFFFSLFYFFFVFLLSIFTGSFWSHSYVRLGHKMLKWAGKLAECKHVLYIHAPLKSYRAIKACASRQNLQCILGNMYGGPTWMKLSVWDVSGLRKSFTSNAIYLTYIIYTYIPFVSVIICFTELRWILFAHNFRSYFQSL